MIGDNTVMNIIFFIYFLLIDPPLLNVTHLTFLSLTTYKELFIKLFFDVGLTTTIKELKIEYLEEIVKPTQVGVELHHKSNIIMFL